MSQKNMMTNFLSRLDLHPEMSIEKITIGSERSPILVVDNFIKQANSLVDVAVRMEFSEQGHVFPGVRAFAPHIYMQKAFVEIQPEITEHFGLNSCTFKLSMCHYSLVTTPPERLGLLQRIPHVDSFESRGLAAVHYLFHGNFGGTAFYRHRKTGFEYLDESRRLVYFRSLESENGGPNIPGAEYINGDTSLFQQIDRREGVFNRLLVYRRNSLHSGCIDKNFSLDPNPLSGRLSINSFIDPIL
ncbi:DUF6445 family protein [Gilvimarinus algae]|uniref:DUF6445 family protein n=1 Tax=Gilvimarinus algae TaxID=3058037 RepID=A0ABT8TBF6_9GAMM|nr:DUF6445 family protein [Gilvimarinus sp. SDUM040014]MDO3380919.1 DUF6445 family protein [Gilvimarinus sp. SDUM040014]